MVVVVRPTYRDRAKDRVGPARKCLHQFAHIPTARTQTWPKLDARISGKCHPWLSIDFPATETSIVLWWKTNPSTTQLVYTVDSARPLACGQCRRWSGLAQSQQDPKDSRSAVLVCITFNLEQCYGAERRSFPWTQTEEALPAQLTFLHTNTAVFCVSFQCFFTLGTLPNVEDLGKEESAPLVLSGRGHSQANFGKLGPGIGRFARGLGPGLDLAL